MEDKVRADFNTDLIPTHCFVYKGKRFPFNLTLFKCFSHYFNSTEYQQTCSTEIDLSTLFDDHFHLNYDAIQDFVKFCQHEYITLTKENAISLHQLSRKFLVPSLTEFTRKFLDSHRCELALDFLQHARDEAEGAEYEEAVARDLLDYVEDERLLDLPITVLHRVVGLHARSAGKSGLPHEVVDFLVRCVQRRGRCASVLFEHVGEGSLGRDAVRRLLFECGGEFDFHFVAGEWLRSMYEAESDLIRKGERGEAERRAMREEIAELRRELEEAKRGIEEKRVEASREAERTRGEIEEQKRRGDEMQKELDEVRALVVVLNDKLMEQTAFIEDSKRAKKEEEARKKAEEDAKKKAEEEARKKAEEEAKKKAEEDERNRSSYIFCSESRPSGIIAALGRTVFLVAGGRHDTSYPIENIRKYDDSYFYNSYGFSPSSESDSFIEFDIGSSRKVDLHSYLIRSNGCGESNQHPKTWRVVGSNDRSDWKRIDRRENDSHLRGNYKQHRFECEGFPHGSAGAFRYIRYIQEDSWLNGGPHYVYLTYFELYGDVYTE